MKMIACSFCGELTWGWVDLKSNMVYCAKCLTKHNRPDLLFQQRGDSK